MKTLMISRRVSMLALLVIAAACGGSSPASPSGGGGTSGGGGNASACPAMYVNKGTMNARIDGTAWTTTCVNPTYGGGQLNIVGDNLANPATIISFVLGPVSGPGIYSITPLGVPAQVVVTGHLAVGGSAIWDAYAGHGSGSVTINALTPTGASGTFSFMMPASSGTATGTRAVEGSFNAAF